VAKSTSEQRGEMARLIISQPRILGRIRGSRAPEKKEIVAPSHPASNCGCANVPISIFATDPPNFTAPAMPSLAADMLPKGSRAPMTAL
jgi:hypothetical protein